MHRRLRPLAATLAAGALALAGCETDDPISPDPEGLEEPADDPEGVDAPLEDEPEPGAGEPAVEGDGEGPLTPDDEDDES